MTIEVSGIEIKIGDTTLKLSVDQAKELQRKLNDALGSFVGWYYTYPPTTWITTNATCFESDTNSDITVKIC